MTGEGMVAFVLEQLGDPGVTARSMFGGHGISRNGRMFALVYDEAVYMKVSDAEAKSSERPPFQPSRDRSFPTFREISADELEDRAALASLAEEAERAASAPR